MPLFHNGRPYIPKQKQKVVISFAPKEKKKKKERWNENRLDFPQRETRMGEEGESEGAITEWSREKKRESKYNK